MILWLFLLFHPSLNLVCLCCRLHLGCDLFVVSTCLLCLCTNSSPCLFVFFSLESLFLAWSCIYLFLLFYQYYSEFACEGYAFVSVINLELLFCLFPGSAGIWFISWFFVRIPTVILLTQFAFEGCIFQWFNSRLKFSLMSNYLCFSHLFCDINVWVLFVKVGDVFLLFQRCWDITTPSSSLDSRADAHSSSENAVCRRSPHPHIPIPGITHQLQSTSWQRRHQSPHCSRIRIYGCTQEIWSDPNLNTHNKYLLFRAIPMNLLLWGCETWSLQQSLLDKLEVFLHKSIHAS